MDELSSLSESPTVTRFKRNVFRSLNLRLVTLGTDVNIIDLIQVCTQSRGQLLSEAVPFCRVVHQLPRFDPESIGVTGPSIPFGVSSAAVSLNCTATPSDPVGARQLPPAVRQTGVGVSVFPYAYYG